MAVAQFGPGLGNGPSGRDDFGRIAVTGKLADIYQFRSTMLRNVELTGPYGHAGHFADLDVFIDHYSRFADKLRAYTAADIPEPLLRSTLPEDNIEQIIATRDPLILPVAFDAEFTRQLTAFMLALTDPRTRTLGNSRHMECRADCPSTGRRPARAGGERRSACCRRAQPVPLPGLRVAGTRGADGAQQ